MHKRNSQIAKSGNEMETTFKYYNKKFVRSLIIIIKSKMKIIQQSIETKNHSKLVNFSIANSLNGTKKFLPFNSLK